MIESFVVKEAQNWHNKYNKPVIMMEYGADTMVGLHEVKLISWYSKCLTVLVDYSRFFYQLI